ncbi:MULTISPECIES: DNA polymerase III subunit epsilon [Idiomarina]|jgi:DNA polymerase-3 subunit epsilon|uniref:DNA polymerase III subunit epsilon n=2 Tax=Idiomarina TaxID=135575 RepID=A0A837NFZ6_9GAMM|nr:MULTISPECIES: DNA polymerase III subunit epsilon [Idiomarina]KTG23335.1 DNA polymerase III subunit epsilon [Idiomarina sp. H105]MCH2454359.1 DNA polymerase III subunit epsilon [Idiomarina sp.]OAE90728.1 DNA polymerase III subunit epsilon [Idiomarina sp. WRN-38]KPD24993.1 DNA polymerase III subunit epsilon [Idiomarina zobellii]RUO67956.1 DNA polymerase III subunit epsilon [Idiomarina piscisalsi]|tara:strand:- start:2873 stop:3580 length:708 start_codon:yes stop_codon:yes gene_type:complete
MRQVVLDTETTGIDPQKGHRIIEIGCVELIDRKLTGNHFHVYINPERVVEEEAIKIHGITNDFLIDKPVFAQVCDDFIEFIKGAQLVIHNAPFDVGHMDAEFSRIKPFPGLTSDFSTVLDTLQLAREMRPGQKNNLDALCRAYDVDNSSRELHGALLDAEILADVYLMMTGGQRALNLSENKKSASGVAGEIQHQAIENRPPLKVLRASADEEVLHQQRLDKVKEEGGRCLWLDS